MSRSNPRYLPGARRAANQGSFAALYVFAPKGNLKLERSAPVTRSSRRPDEEWIRHERQLLEGLLWP